MKNSFRIRIIRRGTAVATTQLNTLKLSSKDPPFYGGPGTGEETSNESHKASRTRRKNQESHKMTQF